MSKYSINKIRASLEALEDIDLDDIESNDAVDESLSKDTMKKIENDIEEKEESEEEKSEDESDDSDEKDDEESGDSDDADESVSEDDSETADEDTSADESAESETESSDDESTDDASDETTEGESEDTEEKPENDADPVDLPETTEEVPVKTPEESDAEIDNQELALDMETVGGLESLVEALNSSHGTSSEHLNKLAVTNLELTYGLEQFGFSSDFSIKSEKDKEHFVKVISSIVDSHKGYDSLGNEDIGDKSKAMAKRLKDKLVSLFKAFIEMLKKLSEKLVKFLNSLKDAVNGRIRNIKEMLKNAKFNRGKTFKFKQSGNPLGSPFDQNGNLRISNMSKSIDNIIACQLAYVGILNELKTAVKTDDFSYNENKIKDLFKRASTSAKDLHDGLNRDFNKISSLKEKEIKVGSGDPVMAYTLVVNRSWEFEPVELTVDNLIKAVTAIDSENRSIQTKIKSISDTTTMITDYVNTIQKSLGDDQGKALNSLSKDEDVVIKTFNNMTKLYEIASYISSSTPVTTSHGYSIGRGLDEFLKYAEDYIKHNLAEEIEIDEVPSTESFNDNAISLANVIKDPVVRLEAITYNLG